MNKTIDEIERIARWFEYNHSKDAAKAVRRGKCKIAMLIAFYDGVPTAIPTDFD